MSDWSDSFCEVKYRANVFAMAFEEAHFDGTFRFFVKHRFRVNLAKAKAMCELTQAAYRVSARKGVRP